METIISFNPKFIRFIVLWWNFRNVILLYNLGRLYFRERNTVLGELNNTNWKEIIFAHALTPSDSRKPERVVRQVYCAGVPILNRKYVN